MTTAPARAAGRATVLRHNRAFRLLWMGQTLSGFGSSMAAVALPLILLAQGESVAVVATVSTAVAVVGLAVRIPAGLLSDRHDQRSLLIGCDLARLVVIGAVAVWLTASALPLWLALAAVAVSAGAAEIFKPAQFHLVRRIVTEEQIPAATSLNQARAYAAGMAGPAAGGLLVGISHALPLAVDAVTFLVSALCVAALATGARTTPGAGPEPGARPMPADESRRRLARWRPAPGFLGRLTAGFRHLAHDPFLRGATVIFSGLTVAYSMFGSALLLGVGREPGGATAAGWALSTAALAGLLGSLAAPFLQRILPLPVLVAAGPAAAAVLLLTAWLTSSVLAFAAGFSALCLLVPAVNAAVVTAMVTSVPQEIYGRVTTANDFVVQLLQPCAPLAVGALLVTCSLPVTGLVLAAVFAALALLALALPTPRPAPTTGTPQSVGSET